MLEYILTRPFDQALVRAAEGLSYLVLDELHTYRGRQGADVALLVRRVRDACKATEPAVRWHVRDVGWPGDVRGAACRGGEGREPPVRHDGRAGERDRRDASPGDFATSTWRIATSSPAC